MFLLLSASVSIFLPLPSHPQRHTRTQTMACQVPTHTVQIIYSDLLSGYFTSPIQTNFTAIQVSLGIVSLSDFLGEISFYEALRNTYCSCGICWLERYPVHSVPLANSFLTHFQPQYPVSCIFSFHGQPS